ncbi:hypothetical protein [Cohnella sp.]|uniref:hypothetical protein n=1 Tax=Cohnella sp. TaxID=1883426 RepID=UPI003562EB6D
MILPWIVIITFLLLLFSLLVTQGAILYYSSSITAERAAFNWSNSAKETQTGAYPEGQYDGLYWRLLDDSLVKGLFGLVSEEEGAEVKIELYSGMQKGKGSGVADKLRKLGFQLISSQEDLNGAMSYSNIGVKRQIGVNLSAGWLPEPLIWLRGEDASVAQATALVVEPTEFIRSFDLARYYASKMKSAPEGSTAFREKAAVILRKRGS